MVNHIYAFVILFVISIVKISSEPNYPCKSHDDCKSNKRVSFESCSLCADTPSGKSCVFPFTYMFPQDNLRCDYEPCSMNCPNGLGVCDKVYTPACACNEPFYGSQCQYKATAGQIPVTYITWWFKGLITVDEETELKFVFGQSRDYSNTFLQLSTDDGYIVQKSGWEQTYGGCYYGSAECTVLPFPVKYPYKMFGNTYNNNPTTFITLNDRVVGYYANFSILIFDLRKLVYSKQYQIVVSYERKILKCIASIQLSHCSQSSTSPTIFTRPNGIDFASKLTYVADGGYISTSVSDEKCSEGNKFAWKMWSNTGVEETTPPLFESYSSQAWSLNPYSVDIGVYKVLFKVKNVKTLSINFAYCHLRVKGLPLIVRVEGGSDRMINKNSGVTLSASRSSDPNMPASKQHDLFVEWRCVRLEPPTNFDPVCKPKVMRAAIPYFISPKRLMYSAVYNFTLKLWSSLYTDCYNCEINPQFTFVRIQVGNETSNKSISIQCVENCADIVNPNEPLFLKVTSENINVTDTNFEWVYSNDSVTVHALENREDLPQFMMLIDEGFLMCNAEYTITARDYSEGAYAKYTFVVESLLYTEECKVEPQNGTKGLTEFDITCPLMDDTAFIYEFYDKYHEETMSKSHFNGRMIGTTSTGELQNVRLSRGYVTIFITNSRGLWITKEVIVELSDWNIPDDVMDYFKKNLTDSLNYNNDEREVVRLSSLITDILPTKENDDFEFLLQSLSSIKIDTFARIKLISSTLHIVLNGFNKFTQLKLHTALLVNAVDFMGELTDMFRGCVFNRGSSQYSPSKIIKAMAEVILQSSSVLMKCRGNNTVDIYQDVLSSAEKEELRYGFYIIENIIDDLKDVLSFIQYPGKPPLHISTNSSDMKIWAMTNDINYTLRRFLDRDDNIPVDIPAVLMNSLTSKAHHRDLLLQCAYIGDSNFNWFKSDIRSTFVSLSLATRERHDDLSYIQLLEDPITIHMIMNDNLQNIKLEDSVVQSDSNLHRDLLDLSVKIHRLDIRPRSLITITFNYPPTNGSLRVSLMEEYRPDFNHMIKHAISISNDSLTFPHRYHPYDEPKFLYLGLIPGKEVPVNQTVKYSFEINTTLCQYWSRNSWKSDGCLIHHNTHGKNVSCQCTHLSTFGAAFLVPPQQVDPFGDAKLFLTVLDNPLVVALVVAFLVVYSILCIFLRRADKKDANRKPVVVLKDNFSFDKFPYLLAVFTSPRLRAGTTANVGLKLLGSEGESRAHILRSDNRKVLKTGSDDWFLINCPKHLGKIQYIYLWHDNAGWSPSWYCDNINVYDLTNNTETKFIVEQWLELSIISDKHRCFPEARVLPSEVEDISSVKRNFLQNVVLGVRDGHKLLRVFYRHPRSQISRVQRLSIIMLYIMIAMLCSIMFYVPDDENQMGMDDYSYSVGVKEFVISIQCLVISALLTWVVLFSFKRSFKLTSQTETKGSTQSTKRVVNKRTFYSNFVRYITPILKNPPLDPVKLPNTPKVMERRLCWYTIAWIGCITIILLCAYFVMLYGLKLGSVKSKKWLSSVLLAVGEDALITAPLKIIVFALGLAITFQLFVDVNTYRINVNDVLYKENVFGDSDDIKVLNVRQQKMYAPLSRRKRLQIIQSKQVWSDWWAFVEFIVAIAFVVVMCNVIYVLWSSHYYTNNHIREMIAETKYPLMHSIRFNNVSDITKMQNYLGHTIVNIIYNSRWYNRQLISKSNFVQSNQMTSDFINKLVGRLKIRQLRTEPIHCSNLVIKDKMCIPEWKESSEDTNLYSRGWKPATYIDVQKGSSYWGYRDKTTLFNPTLDRLFGTSGRLFHDGGYSVTLGPTPQEAEQTLDELYDYGWQDKKTRVVFVELTTFNGNQALFSQVTLVAEFLITSNVLLRSQVISVSSTYEVNLWDLLFAFFIILQSVQTVYLISYNGLLEFLSSGFYNITTMFDIILGATSIALFFVHFYSASKYTDELEKSGYDEYFDFDACFQYFGLLQIVLSILLCVAIIRVFGSIRGGESFITNVNTFTSSSRLLYFMIIITVLVFFVLNQWTRIFNIIPFSIKELYVNRKSLIHVTNQELKNTIIKVFVVLKTVTIYVVSAIFLIIFVYNTKLSKTFKSNKTERLNFFTFIMARIVNRWNKLLSK